jgi:serine/threonine protein kinase
MALYIIAEAARGLHYAHTRRDDVTGRALEIIHRDISPQNILVSYNAEVKVTDFGIASADSNFKSTETKAGIVKGKYSYMSPEQITAKKLDPRSDVFALAIVLWEMLSMRRLFSANNEVEVIDLVKNCKIPYSLKTQNQEVSSDVEACVIKALSKDPSRRFTSMDDFERTLRSILNREFPNFTVGDLGNLVKNVMSKKYESGQQEIKKMLTSSSLRGAIKQGGSIELELEKPTGSANTLTVSRIATSLPAQNILSSPPKPINGQNPSNSSGKMNHSRSPQLKKGKSLNPQTLLTAAIIVLALGAVIFKIHTNSAKDMVSVVVRTSPQNVRIKLNGYQISNNSYSTTPVKIKVERGANILEISRPGYQSETITIDTKKGDQRRSDLITLKRKSSLIRAFVRLESNQDSARVSINNGQWTRTLSPKQPLLEISDLEEGVRSEIEVNQTNAPTFKCNFTPTTAPQKIYTLVLDTTKQRCEATLTPEKQNR